MLETLYDILQLADPELHAHLTRAELPPYFAMSWMLTWHTHEARDLDVASRLFDLFLGQPPLLPLYLARPGGRVVLLSGRYSGIIYRVYPFQIVLTIHCNTQSPT